MTEPDPVDDAAVLEFLAVMRRLRAECPWKAAQTRRFLGMLCGRFSVGPMEDHAAAAEAATREHPLPIFLPEPV